MIDLRSDTVTRPSPGMREAIASADVADDQYGEDPSVNALQDRVAELLGKEAALFVPSGTMANQLALKLFTQPGDDVIVGVESHAVWHEAGAGAANAGVHFTDIGSDGLFTADEFLAARKPQGHALYPPTTLVQVENTQNRRGGRVWSLDELRRVGEAARSVGVASYLDGARLWNAAAARGDTLASLAAPFDLVSVALSKGLGCPVGSVMAGSRSDVDQLVRHRRMLGGALRQAGVLAAAGLYALDHHVDRLVDDHAHARLIGDRLAPVADVVPVESNIVVFRLRSGDAADVVAAAQAEGVLVMAFGPRTIRAVTHLDVTRDECTTAAEVLAGALSVA